MSEEKLMGKFKENLVTVGLQDKEKIIEVDKNKVLPKLSFEKIEVVYRDGEKVYKESYDRMKSIFENMYGTSDMGNTTDTSDSKDVSDSKDISDSKDNYDSNNVYGSNNNYDSKDSSGFGTSGNDNVKKTDHIISNPLISNRAYWQSFPVENKQQKKFYSSVSMGKKTGFKLWMDYKVFLQNDLDKFKKELFYSGRLEPGVTYSVLFKVCKKNVYLMMGDRQQKVVFNSIDDSFFVEFFDSIIDELNELFEEYPKELGYTCDTILLDFWRVDVKDNIKISNMGDLEEDLSKPVYEFAKIGFNYFGGSISQMKGMPITVNLLDDRLEVSGLEGKQDMVKFPEKFLEKFNSGNLKYKFDENSKFYLIKHQNKHFVVVTDKIDENIVGKRCFNRYGNLITELKDTLEENGNLIRESGNLLTILNNNELLYSERKINFDPIKNDFKEKDGKGLPNSNIGVLDLETYENDSIGYCYAIGYYSIKDGSCNTFYLERDLDSSKLIHNCIHEMLRPKYKNTVFYVHNLGGFDAPFIVKALSLFNKTEEGVKNPYIFDVITRNSSILKLTIKRKIDNLVRTVKILDSYAVLPRSLKDLGKAFKVDTVKSYFPYTFCTKDTLWYRGKTPDISYYKNIPIEEYNKLYKEVWDLQKECISYLEKDLISLYQVIVKSNKAVHFLFDIQMSECVTISAVSMKTFLNKYYNSKEKGIPLIKNKTIYDDIHSAYYGGRVEVYNPIVDMDCNYYDVNSLYPYASLYDIPGLECVYIEAVKQKVELDGLFGFFYCKIKSKNNYLGLLPLRTKTTLIFPIGEWEGWYFSEELKFAKDNDYEIEVLRGYKFNKVSGVFNKFVGDIYKIKSNPRNNVEKGIAKLVLNSLIGRFGMNFLKNVSKLVDKEAHNHICITRVLKSFIEIDENTYLDNYQPNIDKEVCDKFGVDFVKVLNTENFDEIKATRTHKSVSISTAAAVLSYARIHMSKIKLYILNNGGKIYYTDTDSIVTNIKLPDEMVDPKEIGKLKLEHVIKEGYFISDKTYSFKNIDGELIKRAKGVDSSSLTYEDYEKMYNMEILEDTVRTSTYRDYAKGSVTILHEKIKLNPTSYNKRERIFKDGKWVGTKPRVVTPS